MLPWSVNSAGRCSRDFLLYRPSGRSDTELDWDRSEIFGVVNGAAEGSKWLRFVAGRALQLQIDRALVDGDEGLAEECTDLLKVARKLTAHSCKSFVNNLAVHDPNTRSDTVGLTMQGHWKGKDVQMPIKYTRNRTEVPLQMVAQLSEDLRQGWRPPGAEVEYGADGLPADPRYVRIGGAADQAIPTVMVPLPPPGPLEFVERDDSEDPQHLIPLPDLQFNDADSDRTSSAARGSEDEDLFGNRYHLATPRGSPRANTMIEEGVPYEVCHWASDGQEDRQEQASPDEEAPREIGLQTPEFDEPMGDDEEESDEDQEEAPLFYCKPIKSMGHSSAKFHVQSLLDPSVSACPYGGKISTLMLVPEDSVVTAEVCKTCCKRHPKLAWWVEQRQEFEQSAAA